MHQCLFIRQRRGLHHQCEKSNHYLGYEGVTSVQLKHTLTGTTLPHRELLTESQRLSLQTPASDERGRVRHYTLSSEDLALINRRRGDPNRLGCALILCSLRFPGRILQQGEQPPAALCAFVAEQLGFEPQRCEKLL